MNKIKNWLIYAAKYIVYLAKFIFWEMKKLVRKYPKHAGIAVGVILLCVAVLLAAPGFLKWLYAPRPLPLTTAPVNSGYQFAATDKKTQFSALIGESGNNTPKVQATFGAVSVDFVLSDLNQNISKPSKTNNKVVFKDVRTNVDLSYQTLTNGIKEEIIVKAPSEGNAFTFTLNNFGAAPRKIAPDTYGTVFYDTKGAYAFHFSKPFAVDAKGNRTDNVLLSIHKADKDTSYKATVIVNKKWLADPARVYPITIDPTVVYDTSAEFAAGQLNRATDTGSGASPNLTTYYQELAADINTVALWHMNEASSNILDSSGNSNTGTPTGTSIVTGLFGNARNFTGTGDFITVTDATSLKPTKITMETWIKTTSSADAYIINKHNAASPYQGYSLDINGVTAGKISCFVGGSAWTTGSTSVNDGNWHHIACLYDGVNVSIYIDGKLDAVQAQTATLSYAVNMYIGGVNGAASFVGTIDEMRISNIARTPEEIKMDAQRRPYSVYTSDVIDFTSLASGWNSLSWTELGVNTGDGETLKDATSLVAQWNFNATTSTATATNDAGSCGASCNGTLTNFTNTTGQDALAGSGWTANNRKWGAGALMFDGTDDFVDAGNNAALAPTSAITVEAWVKFSGWYTGSCLVNAIVMKGQDSTNGWYGLYARDTGGCGAATNTKTVGFGLRFSDGTQSTSVGNTNLATGMWYHLVGTYDGSTIKTYVNGVLDGQTSIVKTMAASAENLLIGKMNTASFNYWLNGTVDSTRIYSRALAASEILSNYQAGNVELQTRVGTSTDANDGTWEAWAPVTGETAIASMDSDSANWTQDYTTTVGPYTKILLHMDGADASTTFTDETGKVWTKYNHAQIDTAQSKFGGASALLDGTDDYVTTPYTSDVDFGTGDFTVDAWIRKNGTLAYPGIISTVTGVTGWNFGLGGSDNKLRFFSTSANGVSTGTIADLTWTHVAFVRTGNTGTFYINGTASGTLNLTGLSVNSGGIPTMIGDRGVTTHGYWNGWIDEVRVTKGLARWTNNFTPPASPYTMFSPTSFGWTTTSNESNIKEEGSGSLKITTGVPQVDEATVGLWHLDETGGTGAYIKDSTANANHGTPTGTTVVDGFAGKARSFNGSSDRINVSYTPSLGITNNTIEAWVNIPSTSDHGSFVKINDSSIGIGVGNTHFEDSGNNLIILFEGIRWINTGVAIGTGWHHVAVTLSATSKPTAYIDGVQKYTDTGTNPTAVAGATLDIGGYTTNRYFAGKIDEVRISNVARSAEEIAEAYRAGRDHYINRTITSADLSAKTSLPFYVAADRQGTYLSATLGESAYANYQTDANTIGFWHLDEQSGSGAYLKDSSGNGYHGTPAAGATFVQGKIGKARNFSTSDIDIGTVINPLSGNGGNTTLEAWVYPTTSAGNHVFIAKGNDNTANSYLLNYGDGKFTLEVLTTGLQYIQYATALPVNTWYHVAGVINGQNLYLYVNGVLVASGTFTGTLSTGAQSFWIGAQNRASFNYNFAGIIDEVRASNNVRTADQIRHAYEVGARTHNITVDFKAALNSGNLITSTSDLGFTIDATGYGASAMGSNLYLGDKIIVKENYDGTEYIAQGTVNAVNASTGAVTVAAWDTGSTVPSGGFTVNATVFKWQREYFDLRGSLATQRDAITNLTLRETDGSQGATVWLDDFRSSGGYLTTPAGSTITSSTGSRYFQYRMIQASFDTNVSTSVTSATIDYVFNVPCAPTIGTATAVSSSSIQWNFTGGCQGSSAIIGFKVYDTSNTLMATCTGAAITSCTETGLSTNTQYTRKVVAYNASGNSGYSATASKYTLAVVPGMPATSSPTTTTVGVNPDPGTNPSGTQMALYVEVGTTCDGTGGNYIAANGSSNGATAVWQTDAQWATVTATGLNLTANEYAFCAKARNGDNAETAFGATESSNGGYLPLSGNFTMTQNISTTTNRYVDGNNAARYVWGLDAGTGTTNSSVLTIKSGVLTVLSDDTIVAGSIVFPAGSTGSIAMPATGTTGQMKLGSDVPLWVIDQDNDHYTPQAKVYYGSAPTNGKRRNLTTTMNPLDCNDTNASLTTTCSPTRYGDGHDGSTTITGDVNPSYAVSAIGTNTITTSTTPSSIAANDEVMLINLQGDGTNFGNVGTYEFLIISGVSSNVITTSTNIANTYGVGGNTTLTGQKIVVVRIPNYTNVTVNSFTGTAWDGTKGGIVAFKASGTVTLSGTINANALGYRGGTGYTNTTSTGGESFCNNPGGGNGASGSQNGTCGGGSGGGTGGAVNLVKGTGSVSYGGAGGAGGYADASASSGGGGGAGGYGGVGTGGQGKKTCLSTGVSGGTNTSGDGTDGAMYNLWAEVYAGGGGGGGTYGSSALSKLFFGSGGGGGGGNAGTQTGGAGGRGGGIVYIAAPTINISGGITSNGANGANGTAAGASGGAGAGGSILLYGSVVSIGTNLITSAGGSAATTGCDGGAGGVGRVTIYYLTSYTGSASSPSPTFTNQ